MKKSNIKKRLCYKTYLLSRRYLKQKVIFSCLSHYPRYSHGSCC